jgi:hypothetical protein
MQTQTRNIDIDLNSIVRDTQNFSLFCAAVTFRNRGQTICYLNKGGESLEIFPGMQESFSAPPGQNYVTIFDSITFQNGAGNLLIIKEHNR